MMTMLNLQDDGWTNQGVATRTGENRVMTSPSWFVINTRYGADEFAHGFLVSRPFRFTVYRPRTETGVGKRVRIVSFLPRYLFVLDDGRGAELRNVPGVANITRVGVDGIARVKQGVIDAMRARQDERGLIRVEEQTVGRKRFRVGDRVQVTEVNDEAMVMMDGLFQSMRGEHRAVIFAKLLGRLVKTTVPIKQVIAA